MARYAGTSLRLGASALNLSSRLVSTAGTRDNDITVPSAAETAMAKFGLAQSVRRVEDPRLLLGNGRYTDDIVLPDMLHGVVLRSPHAAAKINRIDTTAAKAARRSEERRVGKSVGGVW